MWKKCQVKVKENKVVSMKEGYLVGVFQQSDIVLGGRVDGPIAVVQVGSKLLRVQLHDVVMDEAKEREGILNKMFGQSATVSVFDEYLKKHEDIHNTFKQDDNLYKKKEAHSYYTNTAEMVQAYLEQEAAERRQARLRELYSEPELSPSEQYNQHMIKVRDAVLMEQKIAEFNSIHKGGKH